LHECLVWLPHEDFVYLGDTARFPYGGRDPDALREMAVAIGSYLVEEERAKLVVVACNSAAAAGLPRIAEATGIAVVGVIAPAPRGSTRRCSAGRTIRSCARSFSGRSAARSRWSAPARRSRTRWSASSPHAGSTTRSTAEAATASSAPAPPTSSRLWPRGRSA